MINYIINIIIKVRYNLISNSFKLNIQMEFQLVGCTLWVREAAGSIPAHLNDKYITKVSIA